VKHNIVAICAAAVLAHAGAAVLGLEVPLAAVVDGGVEATTDLRDHRPPSPPLALGTQ
jgi:hypothetical protein